MILYLTLTICLLLRGVIGGLEPVCSAIPIIDTEVVTEALDLRVICGNMNITVQINTCALEQMGYDPETDISINGLAADDPFEGGKICSIEEEKIDNVLTMTLTSFHDCNTQADKSRDDVITYYNVVRNVGFSNVNDDVVIRRRNIHLPFSCTYRTFYESSALGPIDPQVHGVFLDAEEHSGQYDGTLLLCVDNSCTGGEFSFGIDVPVNLIVCLVIKIPYPMRLQIIKIWATRYEDPWSGEEHVLFDSGCIEDPFVVDVATNTYNLAYISFHMFYWTSDVAAPIYFHATFDVCDETIDECTPPICDEELSGSGRRRRDSHEDNAGPVTETIGPYMPLGPVPETVEAPLLTPS